MTEYLEPYYPIIAVMVILFAVVGIGRVVLGNLRPKGKAEPLTFPYERSGALFTPAERSFLGVLDQVLGTEFRIFGKVRVADVLKVSSQPNRSDWQKAFNRISAKHFDFVICHASDLSVLMVIELDDKSHESQKAKASDALLDSATHAAGLPLLRFPCRKSYSMDEMRAAIEPYFR